MPMFLSNFANLLSIPFYLLIPAFQLFCIIHVFKTGRLNPWLYIVIFLPGIGSLAYVFLELIPDIKASMQKGAVIKIHNRILPKAKIKKLEEEVAYNPNVANKEQLAGAYFNNNQIQKAIKLYQECLTGPYEDDISIRGKLATALFKSKKYKQACQEFERIKKEHNNKLKDEQMLNYVQTLELTKQKKKAAEYYPQLPDISPSLEADYLYLKYLKKQKKDELIDRQLLETKRKFQEMISYYKKGERKWFKKIKKEFC